MTKFFLGGCFALLAMLLNGCAQSPSTTADDLSSSTPPAETSETLLDTELLEEEEGEFQPSTLYSLLVAEMAGHRGLPQVTLHNYVQEAQKTGDLGVIKRAAEIANSLQDQQQLLEVSLVWIDAEPTNPVPYSLAAKELIRQGRVEEATPLLKRSLELDSLEVIDTLASRGKTMQPQERQAYINLFDELLETSPESPYFLYAKASLLTHEKEYQQALELTQKALQSDPNYDRAILLEADLQAQLGHLDTALGHLREQLGERDHKQLRILYTRLLLEKNQYPEAHTQADILAESHPDDENLLYYLGVLMLDYEQLDSSERYLSMVADITGFNGALRYYHGRIAQLRGHNQQALDYYASVDDSRYVISSFSEIGNILHRPEDQAKLSAIFAEARGKHPDYAPVLFSIESNWMIEKQFDQLALNLLNAALSQYPDDIRLLYSRAMLWEQFDDLVKMEADLRKVLNIQPGNASALNALGYTLTDRTARHTEAEKLIRQALNLKPEDPAILDSMGWVLHNQGKYQEALPYLEKAHEIFPDPEIAAHLGTVYWKLGKKQQALEIWDAALAEDPDHPLLIKSRAVANPPS